MKPGHLTNANQSPLEQSLSCDHCDVCPRLFSDVSPRSPLPRVCVNTDTSPGQAGQHRAGQWPCTRTQAEREERVVSPADQTSDWLTLVTERKMSWIWQTGVDYRVFRWLENIDETGSTYPDLAPCIQFLLSCSAPLKDQSLLAYIYLKLLLFNTINKIFISVASLRTFPIACVAPYAEHIRSCQARIHSKTVTSRPGHPQPVTTAETQTPGTLGVTSLDVRRCHHGVSDHDHAAMPAWLAGCNAEGTKCVNFPNLQQQFVAAIQSESQSMHNAAHELSGQ